MTLVDFNTLVVIPARGGSKGVPEKNIKKLGDKPLIYHTIDVALRFQKKENICISTDDKKIADIVEGYPLKVPFLRPEALANDRAGMQEVLLHALDFYENSGQKFDQILLLQPTSPFRTIKHVLEAYTLVNAETDMVVSVSESHHNPYFSLFEENKVTGFLQKSKIGSYKTRQECPKVYYYNGAVYFINIESLRKKPIEAFDRIKKYVMDEIHSVDIDSILDWALCETILERRFFTYEND